MSQELFDINKLPDTWGILVFPISMSRIDNSQSASVYEEFLREFATKIRSPKVGVNFLYTEGLYMNFEEKAYETKNSFAQKMVNHMGGVKKFVKKNYLEFQIENAFTFQSWFQMYLSHGDFFSILKKANDLYHNDARFKELLEHDAQLINKVLDEKQLSFFLEEFVFSYLMMYQGLAITNQHVGGKEEWVLIGYPGKPFLSQIYFVQKNIMNFEKKDKMLIGHYDLSAKKYYDFLRINTDAFEM